LHRNEVLTNYKSLLLGTIDGEKPEVIEQKPGDLSTVPYGEPLWLTKQYHSPYFNDSHRTYQIAVREFVEVHVLPEARAAERDGTHISQGKIS
jgi:hypothetical protein